MAGKKGMGKGNMNATSHPWRTFWRRKALKVSHRWVLPVIEGYACELASEKGDITKAELRTIEVAQIARGCSMLILAESADKGLMRKLPDGSWDLSMGAKELARFLSVELKSLGLLGLERRAKPIGGTLEELLTAPKEPAA